MQYLLSIATGLAGGIAAALLFDRTRSRKRRRNEKEQKHRRKFETSKLALASVLLTYFIGVGAGLWTIINDPSQLGAFLSYIGAPTVAVIGFYSWKAKAENVVKIKQAHPAETEGMPVDLNNIQP